MSQIIEFEASMVATLLEANLPALATFDIKPFTNHLDLTNDQVPVSNPTLLVAVAGGRGQARMPNADVLTLVFLAVVPGQDQAVRRQDGLEALFAVKDWFTTGTNLVYDRIQSEALHPVFIGGLYADFVG